MDDEVDVRELLVNWIAHAQRGLSAGERLGLKAARHRVDRDVKRLLCRHVSSRGDCSQTSSSPSPLERHALAKQNLSSYQTQIQLN
jgi:hypothetical protein